MSRAGLPAAPRSVDVAEIEQALGELLVSSTAAGAACPPTRASMANLLILCRSDREEAEVSGEVGTLVAHHPSRVLLLVADSSSRAAELSAFVRLHCRAGEAGEWICSEHVTIRTGAPGLRRLPSTVRSLLLGDLPTAIWWATPEAPPLAGDLFTDLTALADQVIYDSVAWADPLRQLPLVAKWVTGAGSQVVADLAWRRPKLWRRLIAQALDPRTAPDALEGIAEVRVEHGPHALTQAWLLVGWLALRLGWVPRGGKVTPGPEVTWWFEWPHGTPEVRIRRLARGEADMHTLHIVTRVGGHPATFRFESPGAGRVTMAATHPPGRLLTLSGPILSRGAMVARQLPDLACDGLFRDAMALARSMAEAVL